MPFFKDLVKSYDLGECKDGLRRASFRANQIKEMLRAEKTQIVAQLKQVAILLDQNQRRWEALHILRRELDLCHQKVEDLDPHECEPEVQQAIASIILCHQHFAAQVPELDLVLKQFKFKFGKPYVSHVGDNQHLVHPRLPQLFSKEQPKAGIGQLLLHTVQQEYPVQTSPSQEDTPMPMAPAGPRRSGNSKQRKEAEAEANRRVQEAREQQVAQQVVRPPDHRSLVERGLIPPPKTSDREQSGVSLPEPEENTFAALAVLDQHFADRGDLEDQRSETPSAENTPRGGATEAERVVSPPAAAVAEKGARPAAAGTDTLAGQNGGGGATSNGVPEDAPARDPLSSQPVVVQELRPPPTTDWMMARQRSGSRRDQ